LDIHLYAERVSAPLWFFFGGFLLLLFPFALFCFAVIWRLRRHGFRLVEPKYVPPPDHTFVPERSRRFIGGKTVGIYWSNGPPSKLILDDAWAYLPGLIPVWIDRRKVICVRRIRGFTGGIHFDTADGDLDGVLFRGWLYPTKYVLDAFAEFGWPVK
jgi:hypothetical protein